MFISLYKNSYTNIKLDLDMGKMTDSQNSFCGDCTLRFGVFASVLVRFVTLARLTTGLTSYLGLPRSLFVFKSRLSCPKASNFLGANYNTNFTDRSTTEPEVNVGCLWDFSLIIKVDKTGYPHIQIILILHRTQNTNYIYIYVCVYMTLIIFRQIVRAKNTFAIS